MKYVNLKFLSAKLLACDAVCRNKLDTGLDKIKLKTFNKILHNLEVSILSTILRPHSPFAEKNVPICSLITSLEVLDVCSSYLDIASGILQILLCLEGLVYIDELVIYILIYIYKHI